MLLSRGAASRAVSGLNQTLNEIAGEVRALRAQTDTPPPDAAPGAASGEFPAPAEDLPPVKSESAQTTQTAAPPEAPGASGPAATTSRQEMPAVVDWRPELAAFVAATVQQHQATVKALQQVTESCRLQQVQIERLARQNADLTNRLRVQAQMM